MKVSARTSIIVGFIISMTSLMAQAADVNANIISANAPNCISKEDMTQIATNFKQFSNLSGKEFCHDGSETANLLASLM